MIRKRSRRSLILLFAIAFCASAQNIPPTSGNGPYVAPLSIAYSELTNAGNAIVSDIKQQPTFARVTTVVIYDATMFAAVPYYSTAVQQVKQEFGDLCRTGGVQPRVLAPIDIGSAAAGLTALINATVPYTVTQGQPVTFDNTALIAAFTAVAQRQGLTVLNPAYVLPASKVQNLSCATYGASESFADLWNGLQVQATQLRIAPHADQDPVKSMLAHYQTLSDLYLNAEKGLPLAAKMLLVESLERAITDPGSAVITDMHLDAAGIDTTTRSLLWWRKTTFSSTVLAHYALLSVQGARPSYTVALQKSGNVNILVQNLNRKDFTPNTSPQGMINP